MKIGLFGGTFNPIHNGHLIVANYVLENLGLDKIIFIPSGNVLHKDCVEFSKEQRYQMIVLAIQDNPKFQISPIEMIENLEINYSYQTIQYFLKNKKLDDEIYFIVGADAFNKLDTWKTGLRVLELCKFVVIARDNQKLKFEHKNVIYLKDLNIPISATFIRKKIEKKQNLNYFLPQNVEKYLTFRR